MSDIPDGVDFDTAKAAIAWEIMKKVNEKYPFAFKNEDEYIDEFTKRFRKIYNQLISAPQQT